MVDLDFNLNLTTHRTKATKLCKKNKFCKLKLHTTKRTVLPVQRMHNLSGQLVSRLRLITGTSQIQDTSITTSANFITVSDYVRRQSEETISKSPEKCQQVGGT